MDKLTKQVIDDLNFLIGRTHEKRGPITSNMACLGVITEEYHEVIDAMRGGEAWKIRSELMDLANGCLRRVMAIDAERWPGDE